MSFMIYKCPFCLEYDEIVSHLFLHATMWIWSGRHDFHVTFWLNVNTCLPNNDVHPIFGNMILILKEVQLLHGACIWKKKTNGVQNYIYINKKVTKCISLYFIHKH